MRYALYVDLNSINISFESFNLALQKIDGEIVYSKFYGFNQKRHSAFNSYIKENSSDIALTLQNRKKVKIDIRQVIDVCLSLSSNSLIDGYFLICSELDAIYLIKAIKNAGKKVVVGVYSKNSLCLEADEYIELERTMQVDTIPFTQIKCTSKEEKIVKNNIEKLIDNKNNFNEYKVASVKEIDKLLEKYFV